LSDIVGVGERPLSKHAKQRVSKSEREGCQQRVSKSEREETPLCPSFTRFKTQLFISCEDAYVAKPLLLQKHHDSV